MNLEAGIAAYQSGASIREAAVIAGCSAAWMRVMLKRRELLRTRKQEPVRVWIVVSGTRRVRYHLVRAETAEQARERTPGRYLKRARVVRMDRACEQLRLEAAEKGVWV